MLLSISFIISDRKPADPEGLCEECLGRATRALAKQKPISYISVVTPPCPCESSFRGQEISHEFFPARCKRKDVAAGRQLEAATDVDLTSPKRLNH